MHRLDKDTSGVMVVAKDDVAFHQLTKQFKNRTVGKVYCAIVYGRFGQDEGLIDAAIGRHPRERKRMSTQTKKGRIAITRWKKVEEFEELHPPRDLSSDWSDTSDPGSPLLHRPSHLGDPLYGRKGRPGAIHDPFLKDCIKRINRQALHAQRLEFNHPRTGERVQFISPIPQDMKEVLEWLKSQTKNSSSPLTASGSEEPLSRRGEGVGEG